MMAMMCFCRPRRRLGRRVGCCFLLMMKEIATTMGGGRRSAVLAFTSNYFPPPPSFCTNAASLRHCNNNRRQQQHRSFYYSAGSSISSSSSSIPPPAAAESVVTTAAAKNGGGEREAAAAALQNPPEAAAATGRRSLLLPVGIFVDLDNVQFETLSRADARALVRPLERFSARINGEIVALEAFGNRATRTWRSPQERERFAIIDDDDDGSIAASFGPWNPTAHHTGRDQDGVLRCGICGARIKLSKKDRAKKNFTVQDKLHKHMKMLHDREQAKRQNKRQASRKKRNPLSEKEMDKFRKYQAAQIDTGRRMGGGGGRKSNKNSSSNNQLFATLREVGVRCRAADDDVDAALIASARRWMRKMGGGGRMPPRRPPKKNNDDLSPHAQELLRLSPPLPSSSSTAAAAAATVRGCLIVLSKDSDFVELLLEGRRSGYLVVSMTLEERQTPALEKASDVVLQSQGGGDGGGGDTAAALIPTPLTRKGSEFMLRCEERWKKEQGLSPQQVWDLSGTIDDDQSNEFGDENEDFGKDSSPQKAPAAQQMEMPDNYSKKILQNYPKLTISNRNDAQRAAAFANLLRSTKKSKRRDLVRQELRIRLHHKGVYRSIRKPAKAGMDRLALVFHWAEHGREIQFDSFYSPVGKCVKMSPEEQKRELEKRNLGCGGSQKTRRSRLLSAVSKDHLAEVMGHYRTVLAERGLDEGGNNQEIIDRVVRSVLGLEEEDAF